MEVVGSARKHGFSDEEIRHALENPLFVHYFDDHEIVVGATAELKLVEVGINHRGEIFHCMEARPKYLRKR